jgi:hypothetical protein
VSNTAVARLRRCAMRAVRSDMIPLLPGALMRLSVS